MQDKLKQKYLVSIWRKAKTIEELFWQFLDGDEKALAAIRLHANSLKESGTTFGFPKITDTGRELEEVTSALEASSATIKEKLEALLKVISEVTIADNTADAANEDGLQLVPDTAKNTALIIQRNADNAKIISTCINRLEQIENCVVATTGAEARKMYLNSKFALIVLDLVLPDRDGREILREIKQSEQFNSPVLVISGVPSDSIYLECMKLGADVYLPKPFDTHKLFYEAQQLELGEEQLPASTPVQKPLPDIGKAEQQAVQASEAASNLLRGVAILVAEDDEMQGVFIAEKLRQEGAEVTVVENGRLALETLATT